MKTLNLFETAISNETIWQARKRIGSYQAPSHGNTTPVDQNNMNNSNNNTEHQKSNLDELFAFGYACKLFRDDNAALKLDSDSHLIPWNGNTSLLIDRYDCRGYLFDLDEHDAEKFHKNPKKNQLTNDEEEIERLCDEERYLALNKCLEEEALYQEEELKRFYAEQQKYGAVSMSYNDANPNSDSNATPVVSEDNSADSKKQKKSKLESFIPSEKLQLPVGMLIPDSSKQNAIIEKTANFVAKQGLQMEILIKTKQSANPQFNFLNFDDQLNPYYKHLVGLIKTGKYEPKIEDSDSDTNSNTDDDDDDDDNGYLHPLLAKAMQPQQLKTQAIESNHTTFKPNIKDTAYSHLIEKFSEYSAKIQKAQEEEQEKQLRLKYQYIQSIITEPPPPPPPDQKPLSDKVDHVSNTMSLITEDDDKIKIPDNIKVPVSDEKQVIDKLADYVTRNGQEFEECIKRKNDSRFEFLSSTHPHYNYYQFKLQYYQTKKKSRELNSKFRTAEATNILNKLAVKISKKHNEEPNVSDDLDESSNDSTFKSSANSVSFDTPCNQPNGTTYDTSVQGVECTSEDTKDNLKSLSTKELQEKRKLKAALFLSMIKTKAVDQVDQQNTNVDRETDGMKNRSRTRSRSKDKSRKRSHKRRSRSKGKHKHNRSRSHSKRRRKHTRSRSRSKSSKSKKHHHSKKHRHRSHSRHGSRSPNHSRHRQKH